MIPKNLDEAIDVLIKESNKDELKEWAAKDMKEAVYGIHFTAGMSLRNGWGLWEGKNELVQFFHKLGITHPDDMSGIIYMSLYKKLNNKDIDLNGQVKHYQDYWKENGYKDGIPK